MTIMTDGPLLEPENKDIGEFHVGLGARLGASAAATWEDSPVHQLMGVAELDRASGEMPDFGEIASGTPTGPQLADAAKPAVPRMDIIEANDRVKKAGLGPHLKLPDQPDIPPAQLAIMMDRARRRLELDTTIERGPQGFIPGALDVGTSFLVGAADPLNLAAAFIPVVGELRYGKLLASAGESALSRATARAGIGAAQGVVGQAALEPLDWYSHTQDGRDFGMADVLHNLMFGAVLGGGLQAGGGAVADIWRSRKGRPLYPYGPGEPLEGTPQRVAVGPEMVPPTHLEVTSGPDEFTNPASEVTSAPETVSPADELRSPSPEVQTINDLPARAHEDAMRGAISDLINGVPVRAGELLEAASQTDPRIAESFEAHTRNADISASGARAAVFEDINSKLREAGMAPAEADANAAIVAARYAARAERLGTGQNAVDLYRSEGIGLRQGEFGEAEGRAFAQRRAAGPDLFAQREAEGQANLPGTERAGQGEMAQRGAAAPLKPGVAQKPADEGLFGDSAAQKSFFQSQPQAPAFYSAVDRAITSAKQDKASPEQWLGTLKNAAGVKAEEMKWLGLEDWLKEQQGSVSKQQLQDYVRANAIEVKEIKLGEQRVAPDPAAREQTAQSLYGKKWAALRSFEQELVDNEISPVHPTKYPSYALPGGENYRELLLTLPAKETGGKAVFHVEQQGPGNWSVVNVKGENVAAYGSEAYAHSRAQDWSRDGLPPHLADRAGDGQFRSSHWDEPNVLAHIRFDDRISDGKKTLHVAEVQSDWHQAGKRRGYQAELPAEERAPLLAERDRLASESVDIQGRRSEEARAQGLKGQDFSDYAYGDPDWIAKMDRITEINEKLGEHTGAVPDAPFKTTWPELSMKRMIRYAAEHGYDRISWDTGTTNAERYDLSKQIKEIEYVKNADGTYRLGIADKEGEPVGALPGMDVNKMTLDQVERALGKEVAEKIKNEEGKRFRGHNGFTLENVDLKVGGEGMAGFYDRILPATVNRLVKKFGAKVEEGKLQITERPPLFVYEAVNSHGRVLYEVRNANTGHVKDSFATRAEADRLVDREKPNAEEQQTRALDITPELRQAAMEQGFPLFQGGAESPRGRITLADNRALIDLYKSADASTFMHETGHLWLDELMRDAAHPEAPAALRADRDSVLGWLGVKDASEIATAQHERWAEGFEQYLRTGEAPSSALAKAFAQFKAWLTDIYQALARTGAEISPEIKGVMDRMLATGAEIADHADELAASTRAVKPSAPRGRAAADPHSWSLFEFLAHEGGLKPDPELSAIFGVVGSERGPFVPGFGALVRQGGLALDEALTRAKEQHYLADPHDAANGTAGVRGRSDLGLIPRDLLDLIDKENRRGKQYRLDRAAPEPGVDRVEEARHIVAALHDELEAGGGTPALQIDPKLEARVVDIVQKEGGTDVLAAYERAIMEDAERYDGIAAARRQDETTRHLPGWDAAEPAAAPRAGAADSGGGGPAGVSGASRGAADGGQPRGAGAGDRAPGAAQLDRRGAPPVLDKDAAWRALARAAPEFDAPEIVAASKAADEVPKLPSKLAERVTAAEKADAFAKQMYDMFAHRLPEQDRVRLDDLIKRIDDDHEAREIAIVRGGSCLFGVV